MKSLRPNSQFIHQSTAEQPIYPPIVDFPSDSYFLKYEKIIREFIPARTMMTNLANIRRKFGRLQGLPRSCLPRA
ncbi:hypothetical protein CEXT_33191 [Caerostris extrusa]|uniref:Uncharacterized protein n=1 Tax=Caerostris extrusa TaxID=172846 RepID=A0AAV4XEE3_CAEEX|nr:hypothetical protein CEXT_33191 [Caerostris extrusa]